MKKKLLVFISFLILLGSLTYAQINVEDFNIRKTILMCNNGKVFSNKTLKGGGVARTSNIQLTNVFIFNQQLLVEFLFPVTNVTITVTNAGTGKIVYSEFYSILEIESIDLTSEDSGKYEIELIAEDWALYGEFEIGNNY